MSAGAVRGADAVPVGMNAGSRRTTSALLCAGLAAAAALIHLQAAVDHAGEYIPYAGCFIAIALLQLTWGLAIYRRASRRLLIAGIAGSAAVIAVWVLSRTAGLPLGPDAGAPETVGLLDAIATIDELALGVLAATMLGQGRWRAPVAGLRWVALTLILFSSLVLGGGFHAH